MSATLPILTTCTGCGGSCCKNQPFPPFLWVDGDMPPDDARESLGAMIMSGARDEHEPCLWLTEDGRCSRYDERPEVCRDFEVGSEDCLRVREFHQIGAV
jgi:uncharacterized protein